MGDDQLKKKSQIFTGGKAKLFVNGEEIDTGDAEISFTQKCSCGADKAAVPFHSSWCDKDKVQEIPVLDNGPIEFRMKASDESLKSLKEWMESIKAKIREISAMPPLPAPEVDESRAEIRYNYSMVPVPPAPVHVPISFVPGDDE